MYWVIGYALLSTVVNIYLIFKFWKMRTILTREAEALGACLELKKQYTRAIMEHETGADLDPKV